MRKSKPQVSVILLLDDGSSADTACIRSWLNESRFQTTEAHDSFSALEELSDFTMATRPEVIYLNVKPNSGGETLIREMVRMAGDQPEAAIISMSADASTGNTGTHFVPDLTQVEARLERLIPKQPIVAN